MTEEETNPSAAAATMAKAMQDHAMRMVDNATPMVNLQVQPLPTDTVDPAFDSKQMKRNRRLCRFPGCQRVIKSQGHCQRHGAKAKRCRVEGCEKQAQGTHDGMCKRHWKQMHFPEDEKQSEQTMQPPAPEGESVYDNILPSSIAFRPVLVKPNGASDDDVCMPLVTYLRENNTREAGWHRNQERRARGMFPVSSLSTQFEAYERQLALFEILLLSGGTPHADFKDLAHAWGREKGFHTVLACSVCERHGEVERKKRKDAGVKARQSKRIRDDVDAVAEASVAVAMLPARDNELMEAHDNSLAPEHQLGV